MRVLVAGATGAVGGPLVRRLLAAGHEVTGLTRSPERAVALREAGADAALGDALSPASVDAVVAQARPEAIVDQLTSLPRDYDLRRKDLYDANDRVRARGTAALVDAAGKVGVRRYVVQSVAFLYAPEGGWVKAEDDPLWVDAPAPFRRSVGVLLANERKVAGSHAFEGLVLRYGFFYGPSTYFAADGSIAAQVRRRRFPIVGDGDAVTSFVHVEDAASAVLAALERGAPGVYNVVDDDPAPLREWLPRYAREIGAPGPRRLPAWLARLFAGPGVVAAATSSRGASNARAREQLGWRPAVASWREGLAAG